ncbi:Uncharacterised protein [Listeria newyorkensis]|nr:Uncharacterised protein [Listeria newyorkensis]
MKIKMGKILIATSTVMVLGISSLLIPTKAEAATKLLTWDLVDSGKHLDWGGSTKYQSNFNKGVSVWNAYKKGVIRKDVWNTIEDVTLSDYSKKDTTAAMTSPSGTIKYNKYNMDTLTTNEKNNVSIHELGHALRLAHNGTSDVMYYLVSTKVTLSINDKASYDAAYKKY